MLEPQKSFAKSGEALLHLRTSGNLSLQQVSEEKLRIFAESLKFNPESERLAHADYGMLMADHDVDQIAAIFAELGVDKIKFLDNSDRFCFVQVCQHGGNQYCDPFECH